MAMGTWRGVGQVTGDDGVYIEERTGMESQGRREGQSCGEALPAMS